jgi:integrase
VQAFARKPVRKITTTDVVRFGEILRDAGLSPSTRAKHLRVLGACLASAVSHGYSAANPVRELPKSERPRPVRKESAFFENAELPRLFAELDGVHRVLSLVALKTGARVGELLALTWADVDLADGIIHIRRTYTDGVLGMPKNHERRDIDVTDDLVQTLGEWWGDLGRPREHALVFPSPSGGHLVGSTILRQLYSAMERAGIPRVGPTGEARTFHSWRHTFSKVALESGGPITWLSRYLGHSSTNVTVNVYSHFERAERKREAALMEGVFAV